MSAVYLFCLESIIGKKIRGRLRSQTPDKRFLNEKYLAAQILRNPIVNQKGENAFPRDMLYNDKAATIKLADQTIDSFKLFDYSYPDCRVEFDLTDNNLLKTLVSGSVWDVEVIYFDSDNFYKEKGKLWDNNTLKTRFKYFVDPTYYPDISIDIETAEYLDGQFMINLNDLFKSIAQKHGIYSSSPFKSNEGIGVLLDFQSVPYDRGYLDEILLELDLSDKDQLIQSVRIR